MPLMLLEFGHPLQLDLLQRRVVLHCQLGQLFRGDKIRPFGLWNVGHGGGIKVTTLRAFEEKHVLVLAGEGVNGIGIQIHLELAFFAEVKVVGCHGLDVLFRGFTM
ncbi:MAG TPA: hypothetical protein VFY78_10285 [Gammaproteobacteria bacterium]|nr:hypothetical protein [Gammaproteobacteria bacterium]